MPATAVAGETAEIALTFTLQHAIAADAQLRVFFVGEEGELPLNFVLYDDQGHRVKMFSRTCKIGRSRELYEYFENNDAIKMKIN